MDMETDHPPLMICEYLTAKSGQEPPEAFPSKNNRCKASGGLDKLTSEKQADLCLGPGHIDCPLRLKAKAAQFTPPLGVSEPLLSGQPGRPAVKSAGREKKQREKKEETLELPEGDEFEQLLVDFEEVSEPSEEGKKDKPQEQVSEEPPSQPFRRELEDWMRGLFKDKGGE